MKTMCGGLFSFCFLHEFVFGNGQVAITHNNCIDVCVTSPPLECERLQTISDNYTAGISDTQRYKCIGNGMTVDVIVHILSYFTSPKQV